MTDIKYASLFAGLVLTALLLLGGLTGADAAEQSAGAPQLVKDAYPILTSGMLSEARLTTLPAGVVLQAGGVKITQKDLQAEIAKAPADDRPQLNRNAVFILENLASRDLMAAEARAWAKERNVKLPAEMPDLFKPYFDFLSAGVSVDEQEIKTFYEANKELVGGAAFDQVKADIRQYLLDAKRQQTVDARIASIGKRTPIDVDKAWLGRQYTLTIDNPVDKARLSGQPVMVDFFGEGCQPCRMMKPIIEAIESDYAGKVKVLTVNVGQEEMLSTRYGIEAIPVQIFFDKAGREVFRHVGFFSKEQIVSKLGEMGIK